MEMEGQKENLQSQKGKAGMQQSSPKPDALEDLA